MTFSTSRTTKELLRRSKFMRYQRVLKEEGFEETCLYRNQVLTGTGWIRDLKTTLKTQSVRKTVQRTSTKVTTPQVARKTTHPLTTPQQEVVASRPMTSPHVMQALNLLVWGELTAMSRKWDVANDLPENVRIKTVKTVILRRIVDFVNVAWIRGWSLNVFWGECC